MVIRYVCTLVLGFSVVLVGAGCGHRGAVASHAGTVLTAKIPNSLPADQKTRIATEQWKAQQAAMWQAARLRAQSSPHK